MKFTFYTLILHAFLFSSATVYGQEHNTKEEKNHHTLKREQAPDPHFSFKRIF
ncbi:hypothetical protein [Bernardetia sp. MNP-M8]|uniref:hypothetical protein n=1 Tax=Bernardetia sp. MNP-M8 TaxID=3127470 RepID=UPI0030CF7511